MADVAKAPAVVNDGTKARPEKPDEAKFKEDLAKVEKEHALAMEKYNAVKAKLDSARPSKDSPANDRFKALVDEQKSIRDQQKSNKNSRTAQQEKYNAAEAQLKALIAEQKNARGRVGFKSVEEIDQQIDSLMKQVDAGTMKLVDEKKALTEVSNLRKQRKGFSGFEDTQKRIDQKRADNAELKKMFDNPEARALSQKYEDNQKELDEIKAAREDTNKNFDTVKAEREKLNNDQKATWAKIKEIKDAYYEGKKAYKEYEDQLYQQRRERQRAERDAYEKDKRKKIAERKLEEASEPAFMDEILTAEGLIRYFDPSSVVSDSAKGPGKFAATAQRTIEDAGPKGMKVMKKDEEDFFVGGGGKKKGKGKKNSATGTGNAPESGKFNMSIGVIEELSKVGLEPPSNQSDVPVVVEKLKEKLEMWKKDQDKQTKMNIEKAQKEIDRLEKEATEASASSPPPKANGRRRDGAKKTAVVNAGVNGDVSAEAELAQEKDATADVAENLKQASVEDKVDVADAA